MRLLFLFRSPVLHWACLFSGLFLSVASSSGLRIEAREAADGSGANHRLVWPTEPGGSYALDHSANLAPGSWANLPGYPAEASWLAQVEPVDTTVFRIEGAEGTQLLLDDVSVAPVDYATHPQKRPNVVVILTDDHRERDLERNGHPVLETPEIDRLAEEGIYFSEAFVTSAACTPSRTSIFLGEWERKHGVTFDSQSALTQAAFARSYPMRLRQAGCIYRSGSIVP